MTISGIFDPSMSPDLILKGLILGKWPTLCSQDVYMSSCGIRELNYDVTYASDDVESKGFLKSFLKVREKLTTHDFGRFSNLFNLN